MGCDIHCYVEILTDNGWEIQNVSVLQDRNYRLFAILAGVRNEFGIKPIALPKGIPWNSSKEFRTICEEWSSDGHSHSYLSLQTILDFDWTQEVILSGLIQRDIWEKWHKTEKLCGESPTWYCQAAGGPGVKICLAADNLPEDCTYVRDEWTMPYYRTSPTFWQEDIPQLLALAQKAGALSSVRLVFFFDN